MSKKVSKAAVIMLIICTVGLIFSQSALAMGHYDTYGAVSYTDNEELQSRMENVVNSYPSAFLDENGEVIEFGGATDCLAYARWVYCQLFDMMDYTGLNVPGNNREYRFENGTIGVTETAEQLKLEFEGMNLKFGSMIFYDTAIGSSAQHAMILLSYDEESVTVIHGNWGGKGLVRLTEFTWEEMITNFGQLAWARTPWDYPGEETVQAQSLEIVGADGVFIGLDETYTASFLPENVSNSSVMWSVENVTGEATINGNGVLTATKKGLIRITATARDCSGVTATKTVRIGKITDIVNVTVSDKNGDTVVLDWAQCPNASGYMVYRSETPNGEYVPVSTIPDGSVSHYEELVGNKTYYYKIRSYEVHYGNFTGGEKCLFVSASVSSAERVSVTKHGNF